VADLDRYSNGDLNGFLDPQPPLPLLTKEGSEKRQKLSTRSGEEPKMIKPGFLMNDVACPLERKRGNNAMGVGQPFSLLF
jgi:hypothetical protein